MSQHKINTSHANLIPGFRGVKEVLASGRTRIKELLISESKKSSRVSEILQIAEKKGVAVHFRKPAVLDSLMPGVVHQGIIAVGGEFEYADLETVADSSILSPGHALLIAADHITDEGNLGAIMRAAVFFGADGLIIPKDRSAKITHKVMKRSSGAYVHLPVSRVVNMGRALDVLNKKGFWIIGAAGESGESIYGFEWDRDIVLVMGSEEKGLSHPVRNRCHQILGIPSAGSIDALNVSVACGVILSEIVRQRGSKQVC